MKDLVEVVMEVWETLRWQNNNSNGIIVDNLLFNKQYKGNRFIFTLIDTETGIMKGYIESDGNTYFNVVGVEEWENFIDMVGW